jgi:uncharacterized membrane protein YphA (DoxX/SURF4 family)
LFAPYLQGGLSKLMDFPAAVREVQALGLRPAATVAVAVIAFELLASMLVLSGVLRWLGAFTLAAFTLLATGLALRFWRLPRGPERFQTINGFFEQLGLMGGLLLVAWWHLNPRTR